MPVGPRAFPALLLATLVAACARDPNPDECDQLLDHYTELLVRQGNKDVTDDELGRLKRESRTKAAADREFSQCGNKLSRRQWECAMKAPTVDDVERCLL